MVKQTSLGHLKCWLMWAVDVKLISILAFIGHRVIFWTMPSDRMLYITLGLYHTGSEYPRRSPILLVCVTPELQWTRRYFPSGASLIFERYFPLINAFHFDWLSRRHQFSSILASAEAARMVSPKCIMLASPFLTLLFIDSVFRAS